MRKRGPAIGSFLMRPCACVDKCDCREMVEAIRLPEEDRRAIAVDVVVWEIMKEQSAGLVYHDPSPPHRMPKEVA